MLTHTAALTDRPQMLLAASRHLLNMAHSPFFLLVKITYHHCLSSLPFPTSVHQTERSDALVGLLAHSQCHKPSASFFLKLLIRTIWALSTPDLPASAQQANQKTDVRFVLYCGNVGRALFVLQHHCRTKYHQASQPLSAFQHLQSVLCLSLAYFFAPAEKCLLYILPFIPCLNFVIFSVLAHQQLCLHCWHLCTVSTGSKHAQIYKHTLIWVV